VGRDVDPGWVGLVVVGCALVVVWMLAFVVYATFTSS
jgi:hypothetical protein